jgi:hypothetical protein
MGDISEMRGLIVVVTLIGVTIALLVAMPPEFYAASVANASTSNVSPEEILAWNQTLNINFTGGWSTYDFPLNGYNWELIASDEPGKDLDFIALTTYDQWWIFKYNWDDCKWYDGQGTEISESFWFPTYGSHQILGVKVVDLHEGEVLKAQNTKTKVSVSFAYNTTAYSCFSDAYNAHDCAMIIQFDLNDRNTSINALTLISMLFTAKLPNVDPTINLLLAFPLWACTGYLVFIFVLRVVGAVFGGGGA